MVSSDLMRAMRRGGLLQRGQVVSIWKVVQLSGHEAGQRATFGLLRPLLLEGQKVVLQNLAKRSSALLKSFFSRLRLR
jgi:hypothetical protein